jgi:hypothetical protein
MFVQITGVFVIIHNIDPEDEEWQKVDEPVQPRRYYARQEVGAQAVRTAKPPATSLHGWTIIGAGGITIAEGIKLVRWSDQGGANFSSQNSNHTSWFQTWSERVEDTSRSPSPNADPTWVRERDALGEHSHSEALFLHILGLIVLAAAWWWFLTRTKRSHLLIRLATTITLPLVTIAFAASWFWQLGLGAELRGMNFEALDPHIGGVVLLAAAWWWSHTRARGYPWFVRLVAGNAIRLCTVILAISWGWRWGAWVAWKVQWSQWTEVGDAPDMKGTSMALTIGVGLKEPVDWEPAWERLVALEPD